MDINPILHNISLNILLLLLLYFLLILGCYSWQWLETGDTESNLRLPHTKFSNPLEKSLQPNIFSFIYKCGN